MYCLDFTPQGRDSIKSLDKQTAQRILNKLKWFIQNLDNITPLPLHGNLSGLYKLKQGPWRIIYEIDYDTKTVIVHKIGHRRYIYK
ncbi:plasmid stabilization system protein [bacterium BMS3Abin07]|nr:plasmid stabilization system protein [bacterium BMS3Abin07]